MGQLKSDDILYIRDSRNQMVFLHHRADGDYYGFQFECPWDGEICYLFCETSQSLLTKQHPQDDPKHLIEQYKDLLAERAFEKHTHGDSQLHPSKRSTALKRYDVTLDEDDWASISHH